MPPPLFFLTSALLEQIAPLLQAHRRSTVAVQTPVSSSSCSSPMFFVSS
jgi:hypothetical protein